jgi:hypothetical protein
LYFSIEDPYGHNAIWDPSSEKHAKVVLAPYIFDKAECYVVVDLKECEKYGIAFHQNISLSVLTQSTVPAECIAFVVDRRGKILYTKEPAEDEDDQCGDEDELPAHSAGGDPIATYGDLDELPAHLSGDEPVAIKSTSASSRSQDIIIIDPPPILEINEWRAKDVVCKNCTMVNTYGRVTCSICYHALECKHIDADAIFIQQTELIEELEKRLGLRWVQQSGRGEISTKRRETKRARKHQKKAIKHGYADLIDRYNEDEEYRLRMIQNGRNREAMQHILDLALAEPKHLPQKKNYRQQHHTAWNIKLPRGGGSDTTSVHAHPAHWQSPAHWRHGASASSSSRDDSWWQANWWQSDSNWSSAPEQASSWQSAWQEDKRRRH